MQRDSLTIRRATAADLPALLQLLEHYYREWNIWQTDSPDAVVHYLDHSQPGFYLAQRDERPVGCVLIRLLPNIADAVECKRLYVEPEARGHGLARMLMETAERAAVNAAFQWIYLDSKEEFTTAIGLYKWLGYQPCERFNDNAQATLFLRKRLT